MKVPIWVANAANEIAGIRAYNPETHPWTFDTFKAQVAEVIQRHSGRSYSDDYKAEV